MLLLFLFLLLYAYIFFLVMNVTTRTWIMDSPSNNVEVALYANYYPSSKFLNKEFWVLFRDSTCQEEGKKWRKVDFIHFFNGGKAI